MSSIENETLKSKDYVADHSAELLASVDETLKITQQRFVQMQDKILQRLDQMTNQLHDLEQRVESVIEDCKRNKVEDFANP